MSSRYVSGRTDLLLVFMLLSLTLFFIRLCDVAHVYFSGVLFTFPTIMSASFSSLLYARCILLPAGILYRPVACDTIPGWCYSLYFSSIFRSCSTCHSTLFLSHHFSISFAVCKTHGKITGCRNAVSHITMIMFRVICLLFSRIGCTSVSSSLFLVVLVHGYVRPGFLSDLQILPPPVPKALPSG